MRKQLRLTLRALVIGMLIAVLSVGKANAAALPQGVAVPDVSSLTVNPTSTIAPIGVQVKEHISWGGGAYFGEGFEIWWGDGATDDYHCFANCGSGGHDFYHTYTKPNTYTGSVRCFTSGGPTPGFKVYVS